MIDTKAIMIMLALFATASCKEATKGASPTNALDNTQQGDVNVAEDEEAVESAAEAFTTLSMDSHTEISDEDAALIEEVVGERSAVDDEFISKITDYIFDKMSIEDQEGLSELTKNASDLAASSSESLSATDTQVGSGTEADTQSETDTEIHVTDIDLLSKMEINKKIMLRNHWLQKMANGDDDKMNHFLNKISPKGDMDKRSIKIHIEQLVVNDKVKRKKYVRSMNKKMDVRRHKTPDLPFIIYADTQANRLAYNIEAMQSNKSLATDDLAVSQYIATKVLETVNSNLDLMRQFKKTLAAKMGTDKAKNFRVEGSLMDKAKESVQRDLTANLEKHILKDGLIKDQIIYQNMVNVIRKGTFVRLKSAMDIIRQQSIAE